MKLPLIPAFISSFIFNEPSESQSSDIMDPEDFKNPMLLDAKDLGTTMVKFTVSDANGKTFLKESTTTFT